MAEKRGIDVSYAQGNIDFGRIDKNEVSFAIIRSSYGWENGQKDSKFDRNIKGFHELGIPCGAYHYSYAQSKEDAVKEAEYCISCIKGHKLELPVFYDLEDNSIARLGRRTCTDIAKAFCDHMKKEGYNTGLYSNPNWLENYLYKNELIGKYELWLAQWGSSKPAYKCSIWQYKVGRSGSIRGIDGEVDLDYMYTDIRPEDEDKDKHKDEHKDDRNIKVGDIVRVLDPINYDTGEKFTIYENAVYSVIEVVRDRVVIGIDGQVTAPINKKYLEVISSDDKHSSRKEKTYQYIIRPGDTLTAIAARYHTTVRKIVEENHIQNPDLIYAGHILKITV